jgi:thymidylate synthase (FAD)
MIKATYVDHMGSDLSVVNAARVSFGKQGEWENEDELWVAPFIGECRHEMLSPWVKPILSNRDAKLINYLAKHKHISPFGHAFASFHVKAPIFVARQLVKHKFLRWNEISRRYVDDEPEFYHPEVWRGRSADKKQGSSNEAVDVKPLEIDKVLVIEGPYAVSTLSLDMYKHLLETGVAPEQARMVLPQSTMTEWYWSGSLDAFADMCRLRCKPDTQAETRIVADQISERMSELFPVSWAALIKGETE